MKNILDTYYIKEYEKVFPKLEEILNLLELNTNDTLIKTLNHLEELFTNLTSLHLLEGIQTILFLYYYKQT